MKILIITGSARKEGNSNILVENFIKGATEAGHYIAKFDAAQKNVHGCIACENCHHSAIKKCVFQDDFEYVRENILNSNMVVFATPVYYFGMSGHIKNTIDRFYAIDEQIRGKRKAALLLTLADTSKATAQPSVLMYQAITNFLGWKNISEIVAGGVWHAGDIIKTDFPQQAYELGKMCEFM